MADISDDSQWRIAMPIFQELHCPSLQPSPLFTAHFYGPNRRIVAWQGFEEEKLPFLHSSGRRNTAGSYFSLCRDELQVGKLNFGVCLFFASSPSNFGSFPSPLTSLAPHSLQRRPTPRSKESSWSQQWKECQIKLAL